MPSVRGWRVLRRRLLPLPRRRRLAEQIEPFSDSSAGETRHVRPFNEDINAARCALMNALVEVRRFTDDYSDQQLVRLLVAVLRTPGSLRQPGEDHELWDAVRRRLRWHR